MTGRDLAWRAGGGILFAAAGGTSLLHRYVLAARIDGPATGTEVVLGLLSFLLASLGMLLLIQGAALRDTWRRDLGGGDPSQGAGADRSRAASGARPSAARTRTSPRRR